MTSDPIADLLISIKNAYLARQDGVTVDYSKIKEEILKIIKKGHYVKDYKIIDVPFDRSEKKRKVIEITLSYFNKKPSIFGVVRISKPGVRIYEGKNNFRKYLKDVGIVIISTPKGLMTAGEAVKNGMGGEVLCKIW